MQPRITPLGDAALLVSFEPLIDVAINARVHALASAIAASRLPGIRDVVPGYAACAVHFNPLRTNRTSLRAAIDAAIDRSAAPAADSDRGSTLDVPVCYGGPFGPDLPFVSRRAGCSVEEVVQRHAGQEYRVFMIGFLPGFPYLGPLDERLALPRRDTPRTRVPAGSVGIAGRQTGIYPVDAPGGWHIIGRTPMRLFDLSAVPPARLAPGDLVRFIPIDESTYRRAGARAD